MKKYAIIIPDGCADWPIESLGGLTVFQAAQTPNLDALAVSGIVGRSFNVPEELPPGSDVATLSLLGYDPLETYSGRAPLEAAAMGIDLGPDDWAIRCNLVTVRDETMQSFTAGHITSEEAAALLETAQQKLAPLVAFPIRFYSGVSYRNLLCCSPGPGCDVPFNETTRTFAPHDYTDQSFLQGLPQGSGCDVLLELMEASKTVFANHPVNQRRIAQGKLPATQCWLWGQGKKPKIKMFSDLYSNDTGKPIRGAMITAVDLLRGIAKLIGWDQIDVPGITGYVDTDFAAKGEYAARALQDYDLVCVHVEATDEAGHDGNAQTKVRSLEEIDAKIVGPLARALQQFPQWRILVSPDHPTPVALKTHTRGFVPWLLAGNDIQPMSPNATRLDEPTAEHSPWSFDQGWKLMSKLFSS